MPGALLVLNAGSSSLKFSVFLDEDSPRPILRGQIEGLQTGPRFAAHDASTLIAEERWPAGASLTHEAAIEFLFAWGRSAMPAGERIVAVGHRVVHGGTQFTEPVLVDDEVITALEALVPLAPLHQPHNVAPIKAVRQMVAAMPQVACFDTAFHRTQPAVAQSFALPRRYTDEGVRRYGFHGLSCEHVVSVLSVIDPAAVRGRTVIAHLGNGASLTAIKNGRSVASTMGFTALDGLVMGTRCGAIDPGVLLYLLEHHALTRRKLQRLLYEESGLLGVSGQSSDMRALLSARDAPAAEAVDLFVYRVGRELGSMAAALGGLDAIVFTGGIGEKAAPIRERICQDAAWLGVQLDRTANTNGGACISTSHSAVSVWVVPANEEAVIAHHTRAMVGSKARPAQVT
jgi:acetate kinase